MKSETINWSTTAQQWLRVTRGRQSQAQLSRKLGFRSNVVQTWETGTRTLKAHDFFRILKLRSRLYNDMVPKFSGAKSSGISFDLCEQNECALFLKSECKGQSVQSLANALNETRFVVSRWLNGKTAIPLAKFLQSLQIITDRAADFIAVTTDPAKIDALDILWAEVITKRALSQNPWLFALLLLAELYPKDAPSQLTHRRPRHSKKLQDCVSELKEADLLHDTMGELGNLDLQLDEAGAKAMRLWCSEQAIESVKQNRRGQFSCNLFAVSKKTKAELERLHNDYFKQLRLLITQDKDDKQHLCIANVHLFEF